MYCGNEECLMTYSIWTKRHQYALQDIQVPPNFLPESVWDARIQNKQCLLCGGTECLESLSKAVKSHPKLQLEMEVQQKSIQHTFFILIVLLSLVKDLLLSVRKIV